MYISGVILTDALILQTFSIYIFQFLTVVFILFVWSGKETIMLLNI